MTEAGSDPVRAVRGHMPGLDGLRGIAILLVILHAFDVIAAGGGIGHALDYALDVGWIGVQLFFVLSGFLISGILLDTRDSPTYWRSFMVRRVLRIFPLYYAVLVLAFVVAPLVFSSGSLPPGHGDHQGWLWAYVANFSAPFGRGELAFPHFWSLCVEEQFYLVWPFVVLAAGRRGVAWVGGALVVIAIAVRVLVRSHWGEPMGPEAAYMFTPSRMDALAIGAILAALVRAPAGAAWLQRQKPTVLALAGLAIVAVGLGAGKLQRIGGGMQLAGYTLIAIGFGVLLLAALSVRALPGRALSWAPLRRIGTYSYGMYVFHAPFHMFVGMPLLLKLGWLDETGRASLPHALLYAAGAIAATFAIAALSYHGFEARFLALKSRLAPSPIERGQIEPPA